MRDRVSEREAEREGMCFGLKDTTLTVTGGAVLEARVGGIEGGMLGEMDA